MYPLPCIDNPYTIGTPAGISVSSEKIYLVSYTRAVIIIIINFFKK
jgi:hypothetical protein